MRSDLRTTFGFASLRAVGSGQAKPDPRLGACEGRDEPSGFASLRAVGFGQAKPDPRLGACEGRDDSRGFASLRAVGSALVGASLLLTLACAEEPKGPKPSRFQAVKSEAAGAAAKSFCEKTFPAEGASAVKWTPPPERPVPGKAGADRGPKGGWTWVNLWASWCGPCVKEMPLLERWGNSLVKDGIPLRYEFWTIDEEPAELEKALKRDIPGQVRWLRDGADLPAFLEGLGVTKDSAIPIHALVDAKGMIRCVRVGSVGEDAFGSVKTILQGT